MTVTPLDYCEELRNSSLRPGYFPPFESRPTGVMVQTVLFYLQNALLGVFVLIFAFYKHLHPQRSKFTRLKPRSLFFVILSHLGTSFVTVVGSWYQSHPLETGLPCWLFITPYFCMVPLLIFPIVARLVAYYRESQWTALVVSSSSSTANGKDAEVGEMRSRTNSDSRTNVSEMPVRTNTKSFRFWWTLATFLFFCRRHRATAVEDTFGSTLGATELAVLRFLKSKQGTYLTMFVIYVPYLLTMAIALGVNPMVREGCTGCVPSRAEEIVLILEAVVALALLLVSYHANRSRKDPYGVLEEIKLAILLGGLPACLALILNAALRQFTQGDFQFVMLCELFLVVYCFFQSMYQCIMSVVEVRRSVKEKGLYNIKEFEKEFLRATGRFHEGFGKHLASEHGFESLAFLGAVFDWEKTFFDVNPKTAKARARKIVRMYVGVDAEQPCNLSENCVKVLYSVLERADEELKYDYFQIAKSEIIQLLYGDSFRRFLRSQEYHALSDSNRNSEMISRSTVSVRGEPS